MYRFRISVWVRKHRAIGEFYIREFDVECSVEKPTHYLLMGLWRDSYGDKWENRSGVVKCSGACPLEPVLTGE